MARKRINLTQRQYNELVEARDWCKRNDHIGFVRFYDDLLEFQAYRRALPDGAREYAQAAEEERPRVRGTR